MFVSFFPQPKWLFLSAALWSLAAVLFWFFGGKELGALFGFPPIPEGLPPVIGVATFWSRPFLWFYIYFAVVVALFSAFWFIYAPHRWSMWSILGSAFILFATYFQVQVSVAVNDCTVGRNCDTESAGTTPATMRLRLDLSPPASRLGI
ncbi:MAG: hypothetical protein J0H60_06595 [Rhizobiales bacterium]|nr:hypothetical protein [Hyphomicrobiales bacterium]